MSDKVRVVIADPSSLIYSDDYRDGWKWGFEELGCEVFVVNISPLAKLPSFPNAGRSIYSTSGVGRVGKMLAQQVRALEPDLVWCHHGRHASRPEFVDYLRNAGILVATYLCDEPYECGETARYSPVFDLVFTMDPCTLQLHRDARRGKPGVFYLPPGVNTSRFLPRDYRQRGGPRALFLGNASLPPRSDFLRPIEAMIHGARILYWEPTGKGHKAWVPLERHPELYANCLLGLNVHRAPEMSEECWRTRCRNRDRKDVPHGMTLPILQPASFGTGFWNDPNLPAAHANPRVFELAACGTCVVNDDDRPELARLFPEMPRAKNPVEFLEHVSYYLDHQNEAAAIGAACASAVLKRHTYRHRAAEVLIRAGLKGSIVGNLSSSLGAPEEWLTTQDFNGLGRNPFSEQTGRYGPFVRPTGKLSTLASSSPRSATSLNLDFPWLR